MGENGEKGEGKEEFFKKDGDSTIKKTWFESFSLCYALVPQVSCV